MEIWRRVPGFDSYEVSNYGNVRYVLKSGATRPKQTRIKDGSRTVQLCHNRHNVTKSVCRLVALAFVPNPNGLPVAYHISDNKLDDHYTNIRWGNRSDMKHGKTKYAAIAAIKDGRAVGIYKSIISGTRALGVSQSCISRALAGTQKTAGGYKWVYLVMGPDEIAKMPHDKTIIGIKCARCTQVKSADNFSVTHSLKKTSIKCLCDECRRAELTLRSLCAKIKKGTASTHDIHKAWDLYNNINNTNVNTDRWAVQGTRIKDILSSTL